MADDDTIVNARTATRRALVKTGAKLAYSAPIIASSIKLGLGQAGAASPGCAGWRASLAGSNEVPPNASSATGSFSAKAGTGEITYTLTWNNLTSGVIAAHIHLAPVGVNGPIVIPLTVSLGTTSGSTSATTAVDQALIDQIFASPGSYYVNVHSEFYPGGEIRDQLRCATPI